MAWPSRVTPEKEAERLLNEIERQYPPRKCSLETYREVLVELRDELSTRINQLDEEINAAND